MGCCGAGMAESSQGHSPCPSLRHQAPWTMPCPQFWCLESSVPSTIHHPGLVLPLGCSHTLLGAQEVI